MASLTLAQQLIDLSTKLVMYYLTPIYIIGILGNLINIIIFSRRVLRSNACSRYFVGMSICQIIVLNTFGITRIIIYLVGYDLAQTMVIFCKMRIYFYIFSLGLMRQFLCLISIDRWIISTKNMRIRKLSSPSVVRWLIIGSICFWVLFSIHGLIGYETSDARGCGAPLGSSYFYVYALQITISSIIPFIILTIFSILTLNNIRNSRRIQIVPPNVGTSTAAIANTTLPNSIVYRRREIQLMKISLLQVFLYVIFSMTATIFPLYSFLTSTLPKTSDQLAIDEFIVTTALFLLYTY